MNEYRHPADILSEFDPQEPGSDDEQQVVAGAEAFLRQKADNPTTDRPSVAENIFNARNEKRGLPPIAESSDEFDQSPKKPD